MAEVTQQDGQKTIVSFVVGLLIGGMLVWAFSGSSDTNPPIAQNDEAEMNEDADDEEGNDTATNTAADASDTEDETVSTPTLPIGDGSVKVENQPAGMSVALEAATFPMGEGWIGVRDYQNEQLGMILGVVRFSERDGLVPTSITLQRGTTARNAYAVVIFSENGDREFNTANDVQVPTIFSTFTAE